MGKLTKQEIINTIKERATSCFNEPIRLFYKGNDVACLCVPSKSNRETWSEYMEQFDVECASRKKNGEYILVINLRRYDSYISVLIDEIRGI